MISSYLLIKLLLIIAVPGTKNTANGTSSEAQLPEDTTIEFQSVILSIEKNMNVRRFEDRDSYRKLRVSTVVIPMNEDVIKPRYNTKGILSI